MKFNFDEENFVNFIDQAAAEPNKNKRLAFFIKNGVAAEELEPFMELAQVAAEDKVKDMTPEEAAMLGDKEAYVKAVAKETGIEKGDKPRDMDTDRILNAASSMAKNDNAEVEVKAEDKDGDGDPDKVTMESETVTEKVPEEKDNSSEIDDEPNDSINVGNIASMLAEHKFG